MKSLKKIFDTQQYSEDDESEVVRAAQNGSKSALEELIKKHQDWIFKIC